jgi:peptidoglycan/xylan/chitin deacetylase (PgdA/CDA1 family)
VLNQFKGGRDYHWLRYPFLSEGDTPEKRASVRRYLADHGYKVAAVTMSFGDYMWNEPYARCRQKGDQEAIKQLEKTYLAGADSTISYYRQMSEKLYNREIPYVLLMHVGAFDAEMLPQLIQLYRDRGYEFVSLEEAQQDDFYRSSNDPVQSSEPNTLERAMAEQHLPLPVRNAAPQLEGLCR